MSALQSSIQHGEYQKVGNYHGAPTSICGGQPCCPHGTNAFLPWHRLFMVQMEQELGIAIPYWDWTEEGEVPSLWESITAPIQLGAFGQCSLDSFTSRDPRAQVNTSELKARVEVALMEETFEDFSEELMIPHNQLHFGMGCDMRVIDTSAYDPVFYLHHTYIDYIFAFWQELQRLRGENEVPAAIQELEDPLPPFNNRRYNNKSITLRNNRGRDTLDYTAKYCYKYQDLKFDGLTPAQFLRLHATVPMHIFIGIVVPKIMRNGYITFDLCLAGVCVQAGKVASFSIAVTTIINIDRQEINSRSHRLVKYDVTELVAKQNWKAEDLDLEAVLTSSSLVADLHLPKPVIIRRLRDQPYVVEVPQGETPADYGDLLESYTISA